MKRTLLTLAVATSLAACGGNNVGSSTSAGSTGGGTTGGAGSTGGDAGTTATYACPSGGPSYPAAPYETNRGGTFPDFFLGGGYWNPSTTPTPDIPNFQPTSLMAFHQLYCSGFKYALVDISAVWCPHCNTEAQELPTQWVPKWLPKGGIVYSVLEEGATPNVPATMADLQSWISQYQTNYPMALDPQENLVTGLSLQAWPANIILDLKTMKVVDAVFGATDQFFTEFDQTLNAAQ
ncbi:MAG: TlpA family protein disulfide reductase [Deltaproteobacteria bacterium]